MKKNKLTNKAKSFIKGLKNWNERRQFDRLSAKGKIEYIKKLIKDAK